MKSTLRHGRRVFKQPRPRPEVIDQGMTLRRSYTPRIKAAEAAGNHAEVRRLQREHSDLARAQAAEWSA